MKYHRLKLIIILLSVYVIPLVGQDAVDEENYPVEYEFSDKNSYWFKGIDKSRNYCFNPFFSINSSATFIDRLSLDYTVNRGKWIILSYNDARRYNLIPYIGADYFRDDQNKALFKTKGFNKPTLNLGLPSTYKICDRIAEFGGLNVKNRLDPTYKTEINKNHWSGILNLNAGIIVNSANTGYKLRNEILFKEIFKLNTLVHQMEDERDIFTCSYPVASPTIQYLPPPPDDSVISDTSLLTIFFRIGSATVEKKQEIITYNTATYLKNNPMAKIKIFGYADKESGTAKYNLKLSKKRAENVARILVDKYNIEPNRITIEAKGSSEKSYKENKYNRVEIILKD